MKYSTILITPLLMISIAQAKTQYAETTLTAFSTVDSTKAIGKILPTTALEIIKEDNNKMIVKLTGWQLNGESQMIYYSEGQKIISALFSKNTNNKVDKLESKNLDGDIWEKVVITTLVPVIEFESNLDSLNKKAKDLYQTNCSSCHSLPEVDHFSPIQWPSTLKEMGERTSLSKDEIELITQFLQKNTTKK